MHTNLQMIAQVTKAKTEHFFCPSVPVKKPVKTDLDTITHLCNLYEH